MAAALVLYCGEQRETTYSNSSLEGFCCVKSSHASVSILVFLANIAQYITWLRWLLLAFLFFKISQACSAYRLSYSITVRRSSLLPLLMIISAAFLFESLESELVRMLLAS